MTAQEYRKSTAKALGLDIEPEMGDELIVYINGIPIVWYPDLDANQQEMVEDWLVKNNYSYSIDSPFTKTGRKTYMVSIYGRNSAIIIGHGKSKSKSLAFQKAWEQFNNQ